jgi:hypothetical protein
MSEAPISLLKQAVEYLHGGTANFVEVVSVHEKHEGQTVWDGTVAVFDLAGHPKATRAYAFSDELPTGERTFYAPLHVPPVTGPREAVRLKIVANENAAERKFEKWLAESEAQNEAYENDARRFWRSAPNSALSIDDHRNPVNQDARDIFKK